MDNIAQLKVKFETPVALVTTKFNPELIGGDRSVVPGQTLRRAVCNILCSYTVHVCDFL